MRAIIHAAVVLCVASAASGGESGKPADARPFAWGKPVSGVAIGIRTDRDTYKHGETITLECAVKNTGRGIHRFQLPANAKSESRFTDFLLLIEGKAPVQFSARLFEGGEEDRQVKLSPGDEMVLRKIDLNTIKAFPYEEGLPMVRGYPAKRDEAGKTVPLKSLGAFGQTLQPGQYQIGWLLYNKHRRSPRPLFVKSKAAAFTLEAKPWHAMTAPEREAYLGALKKKLFHDAWSAMQASEALAPLGAEGVPILVEALKSKKYATQAWAIATAAGIQDPRLVDPLVRLIKQSPGAGKFFYHLWKQRAPKVLEALTTFLLTTKDSEAKAWIQRGLKELATAVPAEQLRRLLGAPDPATRQAAVAYAARRRPKPEASRHLRDVLAADKSEQVRGEAARLLGERGGKSPANCKALVDAVAGDASDYVRQMASLALAKLTGKPWVYEVGAHVPDAKRKDVVNKWKQWLAAQGGK